MASSAILQLAIFPGMTMDACPFYLGVTLDELLELLSD